VSIVTYNNRSIRNISAIPGAAKSLTHIKTLTASSSATLSFVDGSDDVVLDSTYPIYLFKFINIHAATNDTEFQFQGNAAGGSGYNETITSTVFRAQHTEGGSTETVGYRTGEDQAQGTSFQTILKGTGNENDEAVSGEMFLFNPSSTTFVKHFLSNLTANSHNDFNLNVFTAGYFNTTSAIDEIQFKISSGNIDAGTIKLYGLKDS
jgi:hypothetical protein